ncbi:uncharacterized protein J3R85_021016 [Psidium guajava]|nr:uncharacterized protein J3R85_021016 [Psidium guajava]
MDCELELGLVDVLLFMLSVRAYPTGLDGLNDDFISGLSSSAACTMLEFLSGVLHCVPSPSLRICVICCWGDWRFVDDVF